MKNSKQKQRLYSEKIMNFQRLLLGYGVLPPSS
jgi:hypothetical protein